MPSLTANSLSREKQLDRLLHKSLKVEALEDFIFLTRAEAGSGKKSIGEIILCFQSAYFGPRQYCLRGKRLFERSPKNVWPEASQRRTNRPADSFYLANEMGRPFHKVMVLPLNSSYEELKPVLFIEYFPKDKTIENIYDDEKWEIFKTIFSKVLLEEHWKTGCRLWQDTFDFLNEPLVILDEQQRPVRCNTPFKHINQKKVKIGSSLFQYENKFYEKQSYPIASDENSYTIEHFVDVTSRLFLRDQMAQNERMSLLGKLADDIAHNLNNPLTGLHSAAQILAQETKDKKQRNHFIEIEKTIRRCHNIIRNFIRFSKQSGFDEVCDLNEITRQTLPFLKTMIQTKKITLKLDDNPLSVKAEPCLLQQVLFNLIKNALQAVDNKGGVIVIQSFSANKKAIWRVQDNGCGINTQNQERLFHPFFTTKQKGTGLGLRISRQLIEKFEGELTFKSKVNKGSVFEIHLPKL